AAAAIRKTTIQQSEVKTPHGTITISSKIGVDVGQVQWGIITNPQINRATYYFRGPAIDGCSQAEHQANRGDLVISAAVQTAVSPHIITIPVGSYFKVTNIQETLFSPPVSHMPDFAPFTELAAHYYPANIIHQSHFGEFRQVINVFISLKGNPTDTELNQLMQIVFTAQETYGGLLNRIDFGDKGCNLLLFWGAPTAYENDITRALNFLLELQNKTPIPLRAAVTYTIAYAGFIGSDLREEYTCYGRGINLAARFLMAANWGQIWVDSAIAQRVQSRFSVEFIDHLALKGFSTPQAAFILGKHQTQTTQPLFRGMMVGRAAEMAQLHTAVQPLYNGRFGGVITIIGEAGIGKSRLIHEFFQTLTESAQTSLRIFHCLTDEIIRQSLNPFRYFLRRYFNQHPDNTDADNKQAFTAVLKTLIAASTNHPDGESLINELNRTHSFLGALIDLHWPDSLYAQLDPRLRFENTLRALKTLLLAESVKAPFILKLEDSQWLDQDSRTFLLELSRHVDNYPFLIIASTRPLPPTDTFFTQQLSPQSTIHLTELGPDHVQQLAENLLGGPISQSLYRQIMQRANGNPFFAEQIVLYLKEQARITQSPSGWTLLNSKMDAPLPADLRTILVARLDRLTQSVREVVQTASVLGREFPLRLLMAMLSDDEQVLGKVETAVHAAIWTALSELSYLFKHGLMRDAAYEMQLYNQRRQLHQIAAASLEMLHADDLSPHYADLAYHYEQGSVVDKAHTYLIMAANAAQEAYQNHQALNLYERALRLTLPDDLSTRFELLAAMEEINAMLGNRTRQQDILTTISQLADKLVDPIYAVRVALRRSHLAESTSQFEQAAAAAKEVIALAQNRLEGSSSDQYVALGEIALGQALMRQGSYEVTAVRLNKAVSILDKINAVQEAADGRKALASIYVFLGEYTQAERQFETALAGFRQIGNRLGEATVIERMGVTARMQAKLDIAIPLFRQAIVLHEEIGNRHGEGMSRLHLGAVQQVQGNVPAARIAYERAIIIFREIGNKVGESAALNGIGWAARDIGNFAVSEEAFHHALAIQRASDDRFGEGVTIANLCAVAYFQGNMEQGRTSAQEAIAIQNRVNDVRGRGMTFVYLGAIELTAGNLTAAKAAFRQANHDFEQLKQKQHNVEALSGLARVAVAEYDFTNAKAYAESILTYLETNPLLYGTVYPFWVWMGCYQALTAVNDPRSQILLKTTYDRLQKRASHFTDQSERISYLTKVPYHREVIAAYEKDGRST
ncbi:MAG: tetratricopeptide repeat protein, partial [Anaerolineales bacterium]|nr:tetratricopeptide repeat protein [Anaerolineales bacterium]